MKNKEYKRLNLRQLGKKLGKSRLKKQQRIKKKKEARRPEEPPIDDIPFDPDEDLLERAEALTPKEWKYLGGVKNRWPHGDGIIKELFYDIQDGDWQTLQNGTMTVYYTRHGMTSRDIYGHTLEDFIIGALGVSR